MTESDHGTITRTWKTRRPLRAAEIKHLYGGDLTEVIEDEQLVADFLHRGQRALDAGPVSLPVPEQPATRPVPTKAPKSAFAKKKPGKAPSDETLEHEAVIRKIFARSSAKRVASRAFCIKMDARLSKLLANGPRAGLLTKEAWRNRSGGACPPTYRAAWDYPDAKMRHVFRDLIYKEVARTFRTKSQTN